MKQINFTIIALIMFVTIGVASQKRKVLFIGVDGCRPDAIVAASTPNLDTIMAHGAYSLHTWHCGITVSGPSWSSMMTGVWYMKHGIHDNSYAGANFGQFHEFPAYVKQRRPYLYAAEVCEWSPLITNVPNIDDGFDIRTTVTDGSTVPTYTAAGTLLADTSLDVLFVYFDAVDLAGHANAFDPANPNYITAIETVDLGIGHVMASLKARPNYANEDWLVLLMTDHGGIGNHHGGNTVQERTIWMMATGTHIKNKILNDGTDPGQYIYIAPNVDSTVDTNILKKTPVHTDIAVTAIHHLLYDDTAAAYTYPNFRNTWNLDGHSWLDSIYDPKLAVNEIVKPTFDASIFPNPANNLVTLWFENNNQSVSYAVINTAGTVILEQNNIFMQGLKLNINLQPYPAGTYIIRLKCGNDVIQKKVTIVH